MIKQIGPWIDEAEIREVTEVVRSTWITEGKKTREFEKMMQDLTGSKHVISYVNGTLALYASLIAVGIKPGDEVLVPDLTFIASANSVIMAGAKPVFVDVDRKTFCIDAGKAEGKITTKTKAIMPVHLYSQAADMDDIMPFAKKHGLKVVEDAAESVGTRFRGRHTGTFGDAGMISFYGNKIITTAEGAVLLTDDPVLAEKLYRLKNHGRKEKGVFIHEEIGYNFSFTDVLAAIGVAQLKKFPRIAKRKNELRRLYEEQLRGVIEFTHVDERASLVHWFVNVLAGDAGADDLANFLKARGIQTRRFFYPLHMQPCYAGMKSGVRQHGSFENSEYAYNQGLSLPSSVTLKDNEVLQVCKAIKEYCKSGKGSC
ncbi:DegT/DnrJ/EryC1/StrS family aminotransferase [Candidatus Woesearchaeota archaeon]|nr:DegT/DnrJ/EryC1/StrS family aminotransferase [Candidatus Woesearchaeota archaeon]